MPIMRPRDVFGDLRRGAVEKVLGYFRPKPEPEPAPLYPTADYHREPAPRPYYPSQPHLPGYEGQPLEPEPTRPLPWPREEIVTPYQPPRAPYLGYGDYQFRPYPGSYAPRFTRAPGAGEQDYPQPNQSYAPGSQGEQWYKPGYLQGRQQYYEWPPYEPPSWWMRGGTT